MIDDGTLSNLPAGFKARGLRIRDDDEPLQPGEFRDVDAPGGDIRSSLMSLPFKGPDQTLMALLGFVVDAGRRFATITDMKVGDGNQQAAVGTTIAMLEQGSRVMSAVHKRLHYAMKLEFKLLSKVMADFLPDEYPYSITGVDGTVKRQDFDDRGDVLLYLILTYLVRRREYLWLKRRCSLQQRHLTCTTCTKYLGICMRL